MRGTLTASARPPVQRHDATIEPYASNGTAPALGTIEVVTPTTDTPTLRHAAIEAAMRLTDDDTLVFPFRHATPGSTEAQAALGRLLVNAPVRLIPGSPLCVFATGGHLDPAWRGRATTMAESLWRTFEFLDGLYPGVVHRSADPYEHLELLLAHSERDLSS